MIILRVLILLFFFYSITYSFQNSYQDYETRLRKTIDLVFDFNFKEAESELTKLSNLDKTDGRPLLYISLIYVWKFIGDKNQSDFKNFENYSNQTIQLAESQIKNNPNDYNSYFVLSSIYGYRAMMFFMNRNYMSGIWAAKKSMSWTNELIEKNSKYYDAYLWRGLFNFSLYQVPSGFKSVLSMFGLKGDIKQGFNDLRKVVNHGDLAKVEAKYFLSQFYSSMLVDNKKAYELLNQLVIDYPNNVLFVYSAAIELMKLHKLNQAKQLLQSILSRNTVEISAIKDLTQFLLGDCAFYSLDVENAVEYYTRFLNSYKDNQYKPTANFRIGISYYFLGDKNKAKAFLSKSLTISSRIEEDKFHQRYAKLMVENNAETLFKIFEGWNYLRAGKFKQAISSFDSILNSDLNHDIKVVTRYLRGLSYYKLEDFQNARNDLKECLKYDTNNETWAKAFSYLYLARIEFILKNFQLAENYLSKLMDLEGFDFENSVKAQAKNLQSRIQNNF